MNHNEACARPPTNRIFPIRPHHCRLRSTPTTQSASEEESRGRRVDPTARIGRLERVRGRVGRRARASTTLRDGCVNAPLHTTVERGVRYEPCQSNPNSCECHVTRVPRWIGSYGIVTSGAVRGEAKRSVVVIRSVLVDSGITLSSRQVEAPTELVFRVFGYSLSLSRLISSGGNENQRDYTSQEREGALTGLGCPAFVFLVLIWLSGFYIKFAFRARGFVCAFSAFSGAVISVSRKK